MYVCMYVWMYVWMDGWMDVWMYACMYISKIRRPQIPALDAPSQDPRELPQG